MVGITSRNLDDPFDGRIIGWFLADRQACARIVEEHRWRGNPLDDLTPDAILAAAPASVKEGAALQEYRYLGERIANVYSAASKEKYMARRTEMNMELAPLRVGRGAAWARL